MTDKVIRIKIESGDSKAQIDSLDKSMTELGNQTNQTIALNTKLTKTAEAVGTATGKMGFIAQQAGYQIQDFAVQVAGGQSAMLAFGQQAPQLFSVFGVGGAVFGAIIAVSAAIGGVLVNSIKAAKEEAETLPPAIKKFAEDMEKKFSGVDLANRADLARVEIGKLNTEYEKTQERVTALTAELKDLDAFGPSSKFVKSGEQYTKAWSEANSELKTAKAALDDVKQRLEITANISNQGLGTQTLEDATDASQKLQTATESLTQQLTLQKIALEQGQLAAMLQAAAWQTGADSVAKLDPAISALITNNYNLEQQQKATALSASELEKEITALANADLKEVEAEKRREERAKRDQERIDQRIANIRLETQTLASEAILQQSVRDGLFSQEEASLAAQTSARLLAASSEYQQLMEMQNINDEQKIQAELAFQDQILAINQQYDEAKLQMKQQMWNRELSAQQSAANAGIQLVAAFGSKSFQAQKNATIATSLVNIAGGVAQALNNPYPANLGFATQVALEGASLISAIKSTNISGGGSAASISSASATLPTTPQAAPTVGAFEITGLVGLQEQLDRLDNDEVLPVSFTKRLVASLESVQRLQGA